MDRSRLTFMKMLETASTCPGKICSERNILNLGGGPGNTLSELASKISTSGEITIVKAVKGIRQNGPADVRLVGEFPSSCGPLRSLAHGLSRVFSYRLPHDRLTEGCAIACNVFVARLYTEDHSGPKPSPITVRQRQCDISDLHFRFESDELSL